MAIIENYSASAQSGRRSRKPIRVLAIGHSYIVAANRAIARQIALDREFEVTIAAPAFFQGDLRPLQIESEPANSPVRLVPINAHLTKFIHIFRYNQRSLSQLIKHGNFDVVDAWEEPYILAGYQIANSLRQSDSRFGFLTAQNHMKRYPPPFSYFERSVLRRAQGWVAVASLVYQTMLQRKYPKRSGQILNHAVDLEMFRKPSAEERGRVVTQLGLPSPIIGFVGRLTKDKGVKIILGALDQILDKQWGMLFLGSGQCHAEIEKWVARRGLSNRVKILLAKHAEVPRYLGAMDVLLAPSQTLKHWREQFGRMIIEAFASGVPVIASDSGEIPYVVGQAGRIVPESDVTAWAESITELLENRPARRQMSELGIERAKQFSAAAIAEKYKHYYRWLAGQPLN